MEPIEGYVKILGFNLFYRTYGRPTKGTVLCLHGGPGAPTTIFCLPRTWPHLGIGSCSSTNLVAGSPTALAARASTRSATTSGRAKAFAPRFASGKAHRW